MSSSDHSDCEIEIEKPTESSATASPPRAMVVEGDMPPGVLFLPVVSHQASKIGPNLNPKMHRAPNIPMAQQYPQQKNKLIQKVMSLIQNWMLPNQLLKPLKRIKAYQDYPID